MDLIALAGICELLFVKESGLPVPVPGDLIVLSAGVAAAGGGIDPRVGLPLIVAATVVGGIVQFGLLRGPGRALLLGILGRFGIGSDRIERAGDGLRRRGATGVAIARMTPGVRVITIAAAALAAVEFARFAVGLAVGNAVFVGGHFILGLAVGKPALTIVAGSGGLALVAVALLGLGAVGWWVIQGRRSPAGPAAGDTSAVAPTLPTALAWADASCPACLALAAVGIDRG